MRHLARVWILIFLVGLAAPHSQAQHVPLDTLRLRVQNIPLDRPQRLGLDICELGEIAQEIYTHPDRKINPRQWQSCIELLVQRQTYAERLFLQIDKLFLDQANERLLHKDTINGLHYLRRAYAYHRFNLSTIVRLGEIGMAYDGLDSTAQLLAYPLAYLGHQELAQAFGQSIYLRYLERVEGYIQAAIFSDALRELEQAQRFVSLARGAYRRSDMEQACEKHIRQGQYQDLQSVAQKAYLVGRTKLAETYAAKALAYYEQYQSILDAPIDMAHLLQEIAQGYQALSQQVDSEEVLYYQARIQSIEHRLLGLNLQSPALKSLESSQRLPKAEYTSEATEAIPIMPQAQVLLHPDIEPSMAKDSLATKPLRKPLKMATPALIRRFEYTMNAGRVHLVHQRLDSALHCFELALSWYQQYRISSDDDPQAILETCLSMIITQYLHKAQYNLWCRHKNRADSLYQAALQLRQAYALEHYTLLEDEFMAFDQALLEYDCYQSREAWLLTQNQAKDKLRRMQYAEAKRFIGHAMSTLPKACIQTFWADSIMEVIGPAARYQEYLNQAVHERLNGQPLAFMAAYDQAQRLYESASLDTIGLIHTPLLRVLENLRLYDMLEELYIYYKDQGRWTDALQVCQRMQSLRLKPRRLLLKRERECQKQVINS